MDLVFDSSAATDGPRLGAWRRKLPMYDLAAISVLVAAFALMFGLLWALGRI